MMVDHDDLFVDDAYEAATDNEESEVSEFSSHDGGDTDADPGIDAPLAALVEPPAATTLDGDAAAAVSATVAVPQAAEEAAAVSEADEDEAEKTKRFKQMRKNSILDRVQKTR
mmetsp:Transcript_33531/g.60113  ORF Transcript_33531/g.60113 Transcript_33531/m.60113 type:complete len:113 (-) Transcript_33531:181-519(-)